MRINFSLKFNEVEYHHSESVIISYESVGSGSQNLILFHGFGLTKEIFSPWHSVFYDRYRLHTADLFYHGESKKPLGYLSKDMWKEIFEGFINHLGIQRFSVLGFSLGGRFAIASALLLPQKCDALLLLAPDAIYKSPWFIAVTASGFRPIFRYFILNPKSLDRLIRFAVKVRIVSRYLRKFVEKELGTAENRRRVYISWNHFKPLGFSHSELKKQLQAFSGKKVLILGTKDIVIPPVKIIPILKGCNFEVIELDKKHHQLIKEDTAKELVEIL